MDYGLGNAAEIPYANSVLVNNGEGRTWSFPAKSLWFGVDCYMEKYDILAAAPQGSVIVDVGCAHGCWTSQSYEVIPKGVETVGIDPMDDVNLAAFTHYHRCAIDDVDVPKKTMFNVFDEPGCNSLLEKSEHLKRQVLRKVEIDVRSLESVMAEHYGPQTQVHYLKCDCQGKDMAVVRSMRSFLKQTKYVQIESSFSRETPFYEGQGYCKDDVAEMDRLGFEPIYYVIYHSPLPEGEILFRRK